MMRPNRSLATTWTSLTTPTRRALAAGLVLLLSTVTFGAAATVLEPQDASEGHDATGSQHLATGVDASVADDGDHARMALEKLLQPRGFDPFTVPELTHDHAFSVADGQLPTRSQAVDLPNRFASFTARGDGGIDELADRGHLTGSGTLEDPYVLEDFYVRDDLTIQSTDRAIVLRNGYVAGQLSLNYVGSDIHVHHVHAHDLRINENVQRYGTNTGGLWHDNTFDLVGQIRHFTGEFHDNEVGPKPAGLTTRFLGDSGEQTLPESVVFNFDGFHGANVHHNTFHGMVDIKLHGHNHGDCFRCPIHDHALDPDKPDPDAEAGERTEADHDTEAPLGFRSRHSIRYHSLSFTDNSIHVADGTALRYNDRNHAGDDQTANSEPNDFLEDPHAHWQDITIARNTLDGGRFLLDVFNAKDELHVHDHDGILRLIDNRVTASVRESNRPIGMTLQAADGLELLVDGNTIDFRDDRDKSASANLLRRTQGEPTRIGIELRGIERGALTLSDNTIQGATHGIQATAFDESVYWELLGNRIQADEPLVRDRSTPDPYEAEDPDATQRKEASA